MKLTSPHLTTLQILMVDFYLSFSSQFMLYKATNMTPPNGHACFKKRDSLLYRLTYNYFADGRILLFQREVCHRNVSSCFRNLHRKVSSMAYYYIWPIPVAYSKCDLQSKRRAFLLRVQSQISLLTTCNLSKLYHRKVDVEVNRLLSDSSKPAIYKLSFYQYWILL